MHIRTLRLLQAFYNLQSQFFRIVRQPVVLCYNRASINITDNYLIIDYTAPSLE